MPQNHVMQCNHLRTHGKSGFGRRSPCTENSFKKSFPAMLPWHKWGTFWRPQPPRFSQKYCFEARIKLSALSGPVRDTPPYRAIPFRGTIAKGGVAPICLVFTGYRASIAEIPLLRGGYRTSTSHALQGGKAQKKGRGYRTQWAMLRHQKPHSTRQGGIAEIVSRYLAIRGQSECTKIAHRCSLAIFTADKGIAGNSAARIIFSRFHRRKKSRFASDFLRRGNRASWGLKKSRDFSGSGNNRRRNRRESRDFGALRARPLR